MTDTVVIDADVPPLVRETTAVRPVLDTTVGLAVGTALLANPATPMSVRALVAFTGHSIGAVHHALRALKDEGLVAADGLPAVPDLFWEVSGRWRPQRVPVRERLDEAIPDGWALCDTLAAAVFGAPVVVRGDHPPDLYVPDERTVRVCRQRFGDPASYERRSATVAVPPAWWAGARSVHLDGERWPVVHPVIAALDLSTDPGRGREIVDGWDPPEPYRRVW